MSNTNQSSESASQGVEKTQTCGGFRVPGHRFAQLLQDNLFFLQPVEGWAPPDTHRAHRLDFPMEVSHLASSLLNLLLQFN